MEPHEKAFQIENLKLFSGEFKLRHPKEKTVGEERGERAVSLEALITHEASMGPRSEERGDIPRTSARKSPGSPFQHTFHSGGYFAMIHDDGCARGSGGRIHGYWGGKISK